MSPLRSEILEGQKNRADLVKWKLILVSTLGSIGIGLTSLPSTPNIELVLCCIPLVCVYVDLLAFHHALNAHVIGKFMSIYDGDDSKESLYLKAYEEFSWKARQLNYGDRKISAYDLERIVFTWSSLIFSSAIVVYGIIKFKLLTTPIIISGLLGIVSSIWISHEYKIRRKSIREIGQVKRNES